MHKDSSHANKEAPGGRVVQHPRLVASYMFKCKMGIIFNRFLKVKKPFPARNTEKDLTNMLPPSNKISAMLELESWLVYQCIATECSDCLFMSEGTFKARDIGLRAQKKILSRMAGKNITRAFIDHVTASLLDNLYKLTKQYSNNKKESEKLMKNIIKVVIKLGVLHRNGILTPADLQTAELFKKKFRMAAMAIISFHEVEFSYDRQYLTRALTECHKCLESIVGKHLTDKSVQRLDSVFSFFNNDQFLDSIFESKKAEYADVMGKLVVDLNKALENGDL